MASQWKSSAAEVACADLLPIIKTFWHIIQWKIHQRPRTVNSYNPLSDKNGTAFFSQRSSSGSVPRCLHNVAATQCCCYTMLLLHSEKHGPVPSLFCAPLWIKYWFIRFSFYWHFTVFNFNVWRRRHNQKRALGPDSKDWGNMVSLEGDHLGDFSANNNK